MKVVVVVVVVIVIVVIVVALNASIIIGDNITCFV